MSNNNIKFNHWKTLTKELITIDSSNLMNNCFEIMNAKCK